VTADQFLRTLWRGKWLILLIVVAATAAAYVVARSVPKVYESSATLFVGDRQASPDNFQALQSAQSLTKTYAELIQSENVANRVARTVTPGETGAQLLDHVTLKPLPDTQLIVLTAEAGSGHGAAVLANSYAQTFIDYAQTNLSNRTKSDISLVDLAQPATSPIRPRPTLYAAITLLVSLLLGVAVALLRAQFDRSLGEPEELVDILGIPILAQIPTISPRKLAGGREDHFLEAFRILRANISSLSSSKQPVRSMLVTSAEAGEGKTTVTVALARVLGEQGQRVIVVEGDLRRPALSKALDADGGSWQGLVQHLTQDVALSAVAHETSLENVWLIPSGALAPSPSILLQEAPLRRLLEEALDWADYVIFDSPPLSAGADSSILANVLDHVLFVVNAGRSRRPKVLAAVSQLGQAGGHVAGLIVNGVQNAGGYGYYGYAATPRRGRNELAEELATPLES
jgi:receptor protein-tyrosine kinase